MEPLEMIAVFVLVVVPLWAIFILLFRRGAGASAAATGIDEVLTEVRGLAEVDRSEEDRLLAERLLADLPGRVEKPIGAALEPLTARMEALEAPRDEEVARIEKTLVEEVGRVEKALLERIEALDAVVREVASRPEPELPPAENDPVGPAVREALEPLSLRTAQIEDALKPVAGRLSAIESALRDGRVESVEDALIRVLEDRGFRDVVVLDGPVPDGDRSRMLVEARRDGMAYKGPVFLAGGKVVEQRLNPSFPMFP